MFKHIKYLVVGAVALAIIVALGSGCGVALIFAGQYLNKVFLSFGWEFGIYWVITVIAGTYAYYLGRAVLTARVELTTG